MRGIQYSVVWAAPGSSPAHRSALKVVPSQNAPGSIQQKRGWTGRLIRGRYPSAAAGYARHCCANWDPKARRELFGVSFDLFLQIASGTSCKSVAREMYRLVPVCQFRPQAPPQGRSLMADAHPSRGRGSGCEEASQESRPMCIEPVCRSPNYLAKLTGCVTV